MFEISYRRGILGLMMLVPWGFATIALAADDVEIEASLSAEEIFVGESVEYQVEIRNAKNPSAPDLSDIKQQFEVVTGGEESGNRLSTYNINGRVTQQYFFRHIYHFRLTPKTSGTLTIPAATASIDGKTLTSNRLSLRVIEVEKQDLVVVQVESDHTRVYPTQPFSVMLRVFVQPLPNAADRDPLTPLRRQPPHLQINWVESPSGLAAEEKTRWLQPLLAEDGVGFTLNDISARTGSFLLGSGPAVFNIANGRDFQKGIDGKPIRYFVYELSRTFTPEKTGEYSFGPAIVKGTFVAGIEGNGYVARRLVASSSAVSVEVREVPSPRPAAYCGGIGQYKVRASANPLKLRVGDPMTLTIELERGSQSGSLELVSAPDLSVIGQLANDFDLIDKSPTGHVDGMVKKFAYALRPKRAGVSIPSMTFHTFDPHTEDFLAIDTSPIALEVSEAVRLTAGDLVGSMPSAGTAEIKSRAQGIFQNITDPSELRDERINLIAWSEVTAGIWCAAGCLIGAIHLHRRKTSDAGWIRRQQARRMAISRLADARKSLANGNPVDAMRHVRSALIGVVADTRNRIAEGLTTTDIDICLTEARVPAEDRSAVVSLLESIESAEYGAAQSTDASTAIEVASSLISRISPHLERDS